VPVNPPAAMETMRDHAVNQKKKQDDQKKDEQEIQSRQFSPGNTASLSQLICHGRFPSGLEVSGSPTHRVSDRPCIAIGSQLKAIRL
jgi:hypothetical protein